MCKTLHTSGLLSALWRLLSLMRDFVSFASTPQLDFYGGIEVTTQHVLCNKEAF